MRLDRRRLRVLLIIAAGLLSAALGLVLRGTGALDGAESLTVDQRFQVRGEQARPADVVVVGIDGASVEAVGRPPFRRSVHARAIDNLTRAGAKTIVYDLQFSERTEPFDGSAAAQLAAEAEDLALLDALTASKRVVLGTDEFLADGQPNIVFDDRDLKAARVPIGSAIFTPESGGVFRHLPYAFDAFPSLARASVEKATGRPVPTSGFGPEGARIDFSDISVIPFVQVLQNTFAATAVHDKIVVVGNTAPSLGDVHPTPFGGPPRSGPEIHASAISTLLRGIPLRDTAGWINVLVLVGLVAAATLAALRRSALPGILVALGLIVAFVVAVQLAFNSGRVLDAAAPLLATGLAGLAGLVINYWFVTRDRTRLRTAFSRFVPASIVDDVLNKAGESGRLGGQRLYATVMFADLRGFTAAAERLPPETVIDMLNRYLTEMSDAVLDHGGTLVAYQGDGLMAVFGAPIEQADHADRALDAAREMRDVRLPTFNAWATTVGIAEDFRMGIGLASGPVMSGNVGSERRLEYATVGDTTNTAARLEALTKETPHMLLIADTTRAAASRAVPDLTAVGSLEVRGRQVPASVWTLAEMATGPADADPVPVREPDST
jgi:adenylate cyclase